MAYNKVPKNWTENDCDDAIEKLLTEGLRKLGKDKYDQSSQCFVKIARIIRSIPEVKRRKDVQEYVDKKLKREFKKAGIMNEDVAKEIIEDKKRHEKMVG